MGMNNNIINNPSNGGVYLPPALGANINIPQAQNSSNSFNNLPLDQRLQIVNAANNQQQQVTSAPQGNYTVGGLLNNFARNVNDIGTGLTNIVAHPIDAGRAIGSMLGDYAYNELAPLPVWQRPIRAGLDTLVNLPLSTYNVTWQDMVNAGTDANRWGDLGKQAIQGAYDRPAEALLDAVSLGAGKVISKASKAGKAANQATELIDKASKEVNSSLTALEGSFKKIAQDYGTDNLAKAVEALETGKTVTGDVKQATKALSKASDVYGEIVNRVSPKTAESPKWQSINQAILREREVAGIPSTYQSVQKETQVYKDLIDDTKSTPKDILSKIQTYPQSMQNGLDYLSKVTGKSIDELSDKLPVVVRKTENNSDLTYKADELIKGNESFVNQPKAFQNELVNLFGEKSIPELRNLTGKDLYDITVEKVGDARKVSDLLSSKGIKGISETSDIINGTDNLTSNVKLFNATKRGGYNPKDNTITLFKNSTDATLEHEGMHWLMKQLDDLAPDSDLLKSAKTQVGKDITKKLDREGYEAISDLYQDYVEKGTKLENNLGNAFEGLYKNTPDLTKDGWNVLKDMANGGDELAASILKYNDLHNQGYIKPITHGLAEVNKTGLDVDRTARTMAGRFSTRLFGNAKYADIADELAKGGKWVDTMMQTYTDALLAKDLLNPKVNKLLNNVDDSKNVAYISKVDLENGDLSKALKEISDTKLTDDMIPIDKDLANELLSQLAISRGSNPFGKGTLADLYTVAKGNMLASGGYLVGNAQTGLANMLINEGLNPVNIVSDTTAALRTGGDLIKNLGVNRRLSRMNRKVSTPVLKPIAAINEPVASLWNIADTNIQNFFAETAANANLRRKGVPVNQRAEYINKLDDAKQISDLIQDVRLTSLLNPSRSLLPRSAQGIAGLTQPFWRWYDTALQSNIYMLQKHPYIANTLLIDNLSKLGMMQEGEVRDGLMVKSDKPFVSYRFNDRTGKVQEVSIEAIPQLNSLKLIGGLADLVAGKSNKEQIETLIGTNIPALTAIAGAMKGVNKYGRPILRSEAGIKDAYAVQGDKRYYKDENGQWRLDERFHPDELITAALRELTAYPTLFNRTILPLSAGIGSMITGQEVNYYKPYENSLFGSFNPNATPNMLFGGNVTNPSGGQAATDLFSGLYASDYYPERETLGRTQNKALNRSMIRRNIREQVYNMRGGN